MTCDVCIYLNCQHKPWSLLFPLVELSVLLVEGAVCTFGLGISQLMWFVLYYLVWFFFLVCGCLSISSLHIFCLCQAVAGWWWGELFSVEGSTARTRKLFIILLPVSLYKGLPQVVDPRKGWKISSLISVMRLTSDTWKFLSWCQIKKLHALYHVQISVRIHDVWRHINEADSA